MDNLGLIKSNQIDKCIKIQRVINNEMLKYSIKVIKTLSIISKSKKKWDIRLEILVQI